MCFEQGNVDFLGSRLKLQFPALFLPEKQAKQGLADIRDKYFKDNFDRREDPRGRIYYWMSGEVKDTDNDLTSDGVAIKKG